MNKKLYYALGGKKTQKALKKAQQEFLETLPYDSGVRVKEKSGRYFESGGEKATEGLAYGIQGLNILKDGIKNIENAKTYEDVKQQKQNYNTAALSGISDNDALMTAFNNLSWANKGDYDSEFFGSPKFSDALGNALTAAGTAGSLSGWNPFITGGAAALSGLTSGFKAYRANREAERADNDVDLFNSSLMKQLTNVADNVDERNDRRAMYAMMNDPFFALGGEMRTHGSDFTNGLTFINEGGSHEENPNGGVPVGVDAEGTPNLVEQGEVIWDNEYVFSNRLTVPKELTDKYHLKEDVSFAKAIEKLSKESRQRPNDPISNETNRNILNEFMDAQEALREEKQVQTAQRLNEAYNQDALLQSLAAMNGELPPQEGGINMQLPQQEQGLMPPGMAFGGNLFDKGGPKLTRVRNGAVTTGWQIDGKGRVYSTKEDARKAWSKQNTNRESNENTEREQRPSTFAGTINYNGSIVQLTPAQAFYIKNNYVEGSEPYNTAIKNILDAQQERNKRIDARHQESDDSTRRQEAHQRGLQASEYLRSLGYKSYNSAPKNIKDIFDKIESGEYSYKDGKVNFGMVNYPKPKQGEELGTEQNVGENNDEPQGAPRTAKTDLPDPKDVTKWNANAEAYKKAAGDKFNQAEYDAIKSGKKPYTPSSGRQAGQGNPYWIPYNRDINGRDYEAKEDYQNFIKYMDSIEGTKEAQDWIDHINEEIAKKGSKRRIKSFAEWRQLALDGKVGPVHEYTAKAATEFKQNVDKRKSELPKLEAPTNLKDVPTGVDVPEASPAIPAPRANTNTNNNPSNEDEEGLHPATIASGLQAIGDTFTSPDFSNADAMINEARQLGTPVNIPIETIGDYRRRNPFDEKYMVNMANANRAAALRSLDNTTGGNQSARLANVLNYFNQRDLGEVARQAYLANRADDAQVAEFNRGTNLQNMSAINHRNMAQAQLNSHRQQAAFQGIANGLAMRQNIQDRWDANSGATLNSFIQNLENERREDQNDNAFNWTREQGIFGTKDNPWAGETSTSPIVTRNPQPAIVQRALQSRPVSSTNPAVSPVGNLNITNPYEAKGEFNFEAWLEGLRNGTVAPEEGIPVSSTKSIKVGETPFADIDDYDTWIRQMQEGVKKLGGKKNSKKRRF